MSGYEFDSSSQPEHLIHGADSDSLAWPLEKSRTSAFAIQVRDECLSNLDPEDKALFVRVWDLADGQLTDEQILMEIRLGHL